jgi:predicted RNase H-like nuclease
LWSRHLDVDPGDRASTCGGLMEPQRIEHRAGKGMVIVHRCVRCGAVRSNRVARDDEQDDDIDALVGLMAAASPGRRQPRR